MGGVGTKNHRESPVVRSSMSDGSRADARPAKLRFADHEQEYAFWVAEKTQIQRELSAVPKESVLRADLVERLRVTEENLLTAKLKRNQERDRQNQEIRNAQLEFERVKSAANIENVLGPKLDRVIELLEALVGKPR